MSAEESYDLDYNDGWCDGYYHGWDDRETAFREWGTPNWLAVTDPTRGEVSVVCRCYGAVAVMRTSRLAAERLYEGAFLELCNRLEFQCWTLYRKARNNPPTEEDYE